jgi:hypothetical protein
MYLRCETLVAYTGGGNVERRVDECSVYISILCIPKILALDSVPELSIVTYHTHMISLLISRLS